MNSELSAIQSVVTDLSILSQENLWRSRLRWSICVAVVAYGFYTSLAGQPLFGGKLLDD